MSKFLKKLASYDGTKFLKISLAQAKSATVEENVRSDLEKLDSMHSLIRKELYDFYSFSIRSQKTPPLQFVMKDGGRSDFIDDFSENGPIIDDFKQIKDNFNIKLDELLIKIKSLSFSSNDAERKKQLTDELYKLQKMLVSKMQINFNTALAMGEIQIPFAEAMEKYKLRRRYKDTRDYYFYKKEGFSWSGEPKIWPKKAKEVSEGWENAINDLLVNKVSNIEAILSKFRLGTETQRVVKRYDEYLASMRYTKDAIDKEIAGLTEHYGQYDEDDE